MQVALLVTIKLVRVLAILVLKVKRAKVLPVMIVSLVLVLTGKYPN